MVHVCVLYYVWCICGVYVHMVCVCCVVWCDMYSAFDVYVCLVCAYGVMYVVCVVCMCGM